MTYPVWECCPDGANDESAKTVNSERVDGCSFCGKGVEQSKCLGGVEVIAEDVSTLS